ncbi:hypothetical protein [Streptomyces sp. PA5.6]|uniref:hypothetical protein n=1 Tax=Streptomyces sp. PA5.6 TaxID=3035651 RepID=UPI003904D2B4
MTQLRLPIDTFTLRPKEQATSEYLVYRAQQDCMRRFGFRYLPHLTEGYIAESAATQREYASRRYGVSNRAIAAEFGYHLSDASTGSRAPQAVNSLSEVERTALSGRTKSGGEAGSVRGEPVPEGGCAGEAVRTVQGDTALAARKGDALVARLCRELFVRSRSDPRVTAGNKKWAECMRERGFTYRDPAAAVDDPRWDLQNTAHTRGERTVARTDVDCKLRTNVLGVNFAVESELQNAAVSEHTDELNALRAQRDAESRRLPGLLHRYVHRRTD